jgi:hypothetical protein
LGLPDPCPTLTTGCDGESRDSTNEGLCLWGLDQAWPELSTLESCHQAQEKTQQSPLLDHSPALPRDLSPVWEECCELTQPKMVI